MRGKFAGKLIHRGTTGLIPACAGKTARASVRAKLSRAHPRVCGENSRPAFQRYEPMGSSPRVRGKRSQRQGHASPRRLIPACAGKTRCVPCRWVWMWAHPRVCGENKIAHDFMREMGGSSPRVRGKHNIRATVAALRRLIPACAGKTIPFARTCAKSWAHPRVCGENRAPAS